MKLTHRLRTITLALGLVLIGSGAHAQQKKLNIVVIFGDDVGIWNLSATIAA